MKNRKKRSSGFLQSALVILFFCLALLVIGYIIVSFQSNSISVLKSKADSSSNGVPKLTNGQIQIIPTYDGSGQAVHPDILFVPGADNKGWHGYRYWLEAQPYPNSDDHFEDPSIFAGNDSYTWNIPAGGRNPIVPSASPVGIHSDADLSIINDTMYVYYRYSCRCPENTMVLRRTSSNDGITWTSPIDTSVKTNGQLFASPAIIYSNGIWSVYYTAVRNQEVRRMTSTDGINWQNDTLMFTFPYAWHLDVKKYQDPASGTWHYIMLLMERNPSKWVKSSLYYLTSEYGTSWINRGPILSPSGSGWDSDNIYRSTFDIVGSRFRVWYSAFSGQQVHIGYAEDPNWSYFGQANKFSSCRSWNDVYLESCNLAADFAAKDLSCVSGRSQVTVHVFGTNNPTSMKFLNVQNFDTYCNTLTGNEPGWTQEEPFNRTKIMNLTGANGNKKICVMLKNSAGWGTSCGGGINYDTSPTTLMMLQRPAVSKILSPMAEHGD